MNPLPNPNPSMNNLIGPMRQGLVSTISQYLVNPLDRKRLRHEVPLSRNNDELCLPSGTHPNDPAPLFRAHPGREGCDPLTVELGECCVSDLQFAEKVAVVMRTAAPGAVAKPHLARIAHEMLRWIDGLYASPLAVAAPTNHLILYPGVRPDDDIVAELACDMRSDAAVEFRVHGQNALLPHSTHLEYLRGELKIRGPAGLGTTVNPHKLFGIAWNPAGSTITHLIFDNCTLTSWHGMAGYTLNVQFARAIMLLGPKIPIVEIDLPAGVTRLQLEAALVNFWGWQQGFPPASPTDTSDPNFTLNLSYDPADRRVTCRQLTMDDWFIRLVPVPSDGSCFFSSIAIALNESVEFWGNDNNLKNMLRTHWHNYLDLGMESPDNFTAKFVRYITSMSIDQEDLHLYNDIAMADGNKKMGSADDMAEHVFLSDCWVDTTMFGAFLKSLDCSVAVVVLDHELKQPLIMPDALTKNKDFYICLWLQDNHYQPMQLVYKDQELGALVSREAIIQFMEDCYPDHMKRF